MCGRRRVLLVDDDVDVRNSFEVALGLEGYEVECASDGREGLDRLEHGDFSVILLDLMMPGMNGWDFRRHQLGTPRFAGIPVVVLSGASFAAGELENLHVSRYLPKPVELEELFSVLDDLVGRSADGCPP